MPSQNISGRNIRGENIASSGPPTENPTYDQPPSDRQQIDDGDALIAFMQGLFGGGDAREPSIAAPTQSLGGNDQPIPSKGIQNFPIPKRKPAVPSAFPMQLLPAATQQDLVQAESDVTNSLVQPPVSGPDVLNNKRLNRLGVSGGGGDDPEINALFASLPGFSLGGNQSTPTEQVGAVNQIIGMFLRALQLQEQNKSSEALTNRQVQ